MQIAYMSLREYRWLLDIATPRYIDGQFAGFTGSCVDITEIKECKSKLASISRQQVPLHTPHKLHKTNIHL